MNANERKIRYIEVVLSEDEAGLLLWLVRGMTLQDVEGIMYASTLVDDPDAQKTRVDNHRMGAYNLVSDLCTTLGRLAKEPTR